MIIDLFAGPGGWSQGLLLLDPKLHAMEIGVEWDLDAVATRTLAGHRTIHGDVSALDPQKFADATGLIASPPCQDFSSAGSKKGISGDRGQLVHEVMRWAEIIRPEWIACEQVPLVLPIWEEFAGRLADMGYSTWVGLLNSADFGVPQSRQRAVLLASLAHKVAEPVPTHAKDPQPNLFGEIRSPWATMAEGLAWSRSSGIKIINTGQDYREKGNRATAFSFDPFTRPSSTITSQTKSWKVVTVADANPVDGGNVTAEEAARLQSFPEDYPFFGTKHKRFEQIGNAIPPLMAAHVLGTATGLHFWP